MSRRFALVLLVSLGSSAWLVTDSASEGARPLRDRVVIRRDTYGIPHILARDAEAGGFGFGYAQAEDHAEEMGRRYLAARGEAAQHFGQEALDEDVAMRRLDNRAAAQAAVGTLGRGFRAWLRGFVAGFNHYVDQHRDDLPPWIPRIDEADVLASGRRAAVTDALDPPRALLDKYPIPKPGTSPWAEEPEDGGSNAFALSGSRTTSGRPILLGNPHLQWSSRYWEAHITIPGRLDFFGSTLVGIPVLRAGFNDRLAYVQTNNAPDLADILALPLDPARPDHYLFEGRSQPLRRVSVTVDVRGTDGSVAPVTREYLASHLGPVVHRTDRQAFAVRSAALESWRSFEGFYELAHSRSLRDFQQRLARNLHPTSNFTYADADGNILYQWNARMPRRPDPSVDYSLDIPADSRRLLWRALHRYEDYPRLLNPAGGYVQNANNAPWWTSLRQPLDHSRYPPYVEHGPLGLRPQLALLELEARDRFDAEAALAMKFTTRLLLAERVVPDLLRAVADASGVSPDAREAASVLAAWDRHVAASSRGAILFQRFWERYREGRSEPHAEAFDPKRPVETPRGLSDPAAAVDALARAAADVRAGHGALDVAWGDVHRFRFDGVDLPADGATGQLGAYRVLTFAPQPDGTRIAGRQSDERPLVGFGDAWVLLVHLTRPVHAQSVLAYGQTTRAGSAHVSDQIALFASHRLRPAWFTDAEIRAHLEREYRP